MNKIKQFIHNSFIPYVNEVKNHQLRKSKYKIEDMLRLKIRITRDKLHTRALEQVNITGIEKAGSSAVSYWLSKIAKIGIYNQLFINSRDIYKQNKPGGRIFAADGTVISTHMHNKHGISKGSLTVCALLNIDTQLFHDYMIADDCNEHTSLVKQVLKCTRDDLIIADRNYGKYCLLAQLYGHVGFLVRISKNMNIYKNFINSPEYSVIIDYIHNGVKMRLKLIKYVISKATRERIKTYMFDIKQSSNDDDESVFVLCTNNLNMSEEIAGQLYRSRWNIETGFRALKGNFDVRTPMKVSNCNTITEIVEYTVGLSVIMYNISQHIKHTQDSDKRECRFSHCAIQTRYMLEQIIINPSLINITNLIHELSHRLKTHLIRGIRWITKCGNHIKKRGRYKSKKTIESLNKDHSTK